MHGQQLLLLQPFAQHQVSFSLIARYSALHGSVLILQLHPLAHSHTHSFTHSLASSLNYHSLNNIHHTTTDTGTSMIFPGGNTRCLKSYSTPYAFQVHKGSKSKVLFYFQGGGSCWDETSTNSSGRGKKQGTYCRTDAVPWPIYGVFDKSDQRNAYQDYTIVNVLYCSGDNHAGNAVRSYVDEDGENIMQRGAINTESVIQWVQAQQLNGGLSVKFEDFVIMVSNSVSRVSVLLYITCSMVLSCSFNSCSIYMSQTQCVVNS